MICHLKTILSKIGMSQIELAEIIGVHRNTMTSIINHKDNFKFGLAYDILDVINARAKEKGIEKVWTVEDVWER